MMHSLTLSICNSYVQTEFTPLIEYLIGPQVRHSLLKNIEGWEIIEKHLIVDILQHGEGIVSQPLDYFRTTNRVIQHYAINSINILSPPFAVSIRQDHDYLDLMRTEIAEGAELRRKFMLRQAMRASSLQKRKTPQCDDMPANFVNKLMCTRGVFQLRKLSLYFCDFGGSSAGVREALVSENLKKFMQANEHIEFNFIIKRNHHPFVTGAYINGYLKDLPLRSVPPEEVLTAFQRLRNQLGRKSFEASGPRVYHPVKSVQGQWMPNMFNTYPRAELEKVHHIPHPFYQEKEKAVVDTRFRKEKDPANVLLGFDDVKARDQVV